MRMQCGRCLSSMFPKVKGGCTFCTGKDVRHFQFSGGKFTQSGASLPVAHVSITEPKKW